MSAHGLTTAIRHSDRARPIEHGALHKPLHGSVAVEYADARDLARVFQGELPGRGIRMRARALVRGFGGLLAFELVDGIDCFEFLDRLRIVVCSSKLADNRTLAIPVAHTIYFDMGAQRRASMGIVDSLIGLSTGIEDPEDLIADFRQALG